MTAQTALEAPKPERSTNAAGTLKNGGTPHLLTLEDRQRGAAVRHERARKRREAAEQMRIRELAKIRKPAWKELGRLVTEAESEAVRLSAIREAFDRDYGKPVQAVEHSGPGGGAIVTEHREKLTLEAAVELVAKRRQVASGAPLELPAGPAK